MLVAITGYGTNIRSAPSTYASKRGAIGRGGLVAKYIKSDSGWSNYDIVAGASKGVVWINDQHHRRLEIEDIYLEVPFWSQLEGVLEPGDQDAADDHNGDCGFACIKMVAEACIPDFEDSVDDLARSYLTKVKKLAHINDIREALTKNELTNRHSLSLDAYGTVQHLKEYQAAIQLIDYERGETFVDPVPSSPYRGGHFIVVHGMDEEGVYYKNPYNWDEKDDPNYMTWAQWIRLIGNSSYNQASQGIVVQSAILG